MISRLLTRHELKTLKGIHYSPQHLDRLAKTGKFPRPFKPSGSPRGLNHWWEHEIDQHLENCAKQNAGPNEGPASACDELQPVKPGCNPGRKERRDRSNKIKTEAQAS